ncbi:MAG: sel1 repeat family protein [Desulfovibrio sp.]|nr:sel1 repeat family protein [Desulfovibrio sp.]
MLLLGVLLCAPVSIGAESVDALLQRAWSAYNTGRYQESIKIVQPLASDGNPIAQVILGRCYENGTGVPQNLTQAAEWYQLAAEQNNAQAMVRLAYCYELGAGVPKDTAKTLELMQKAAEAGQAEAQHNLALYYNKGQYGLNRDHKKSFDWALKSAKQGFGRAEQLVGAFYEFGIGTSPNAALAKEWFAKAEAKGLVRDDVIKTIHALPMN